MKGNNVPHDACNIKGGHDDIALFELCICVLKIISDLLIIGNTAYLSIILLFFQMLGRICDPPNDGVCLLQEIIMLSSYKKTHI